MLTAQPMLVFTAVFALHTVSAKITAPVFMHSVAVEYFTQVFGFTHISSPWIF